MVGFLVKLVVGVLLWLSSPQFRALVRRKLRGAQHGLDDVVQHGENVSAVLRNIELDSVKVIGGAK